MSTATTSEFISAFASDVLTGLSNKPKKLSSKYIYDERGSRLFEMIMQLPEYYLTRCEQEIFREQKEEFTRVLNGEPFNLVELGAGNGEKMIILLEHMHEQGFDFNYIPVDIARSAIKSNKEFLHSNLPGLNIHGLVKEYFHGLNWIKQNSHKRNFLFFLGSNIGNMPPAETAKFLQNLWLNLNHNDLVAIGFDLKKEIQMIQNAYNDKQGITAQFNLNLLRRINKELGADFDVGNFQYYPVYDPVKGAHEAYIISNQDQKVRISSLSKTFCFKKFEPIHTEFSYKYDISQIESLAIENGFVVVNHLLDSKRYFVDSIWKVKK